MRLPLLPIFALLLALGAAGEEEEEEIYAKHGDFDEEVVDKFSDASNKAEDDEPLPQAVYVMEHGFLSGESPKWTPRGTLLLSGALGRGFEARLSDATEFVQQRPELPQLMSQAANLNRYYAIRMYSPEKPKRVLQASIPAKLLADHFEDWHDIFEVTVGSSGTPVSLSYRVRNTLGLALFDHTQVHISEPSQSQGPHIHHIAGRGGGGGDSGGAGAGGGGGKAAAGSEEPAVNQSFLRKYWWVIIIVLLLLSNLGGDPPAAPAGKASGGGGGRSRN